MMAVAEFAYAAKKGKSRMSTMTPTLLLLVFAFAATPQLQAGEVVAGGGYSESDGFWISSPNIRLRQAGPGVAFGLVQPQGSPKGYSYFLLVRESTSKQTLNEYKLGAKNDGRVASSSLELQLGGATLEVVYKMELEPRNKKVISETLTVNGKALDLGKGRVLLAEIAAKEFKWQQLAVELPKGPTAPRTAEEVEALAKEQVRRLRQESEAVRAFLK